MAPQCTTALGNGQMPSPQASLQQPGVRVRSGIALTDVRLHGAKTEQVGVGIAA